MADGKEGKMKQLKNILALLMVGLMLMATSCEMIDGVLDSFLNQNPSVEGENDPTNEPKPEPEHQHTLTYVAAKSKQKYVNGNTAYYKCQCGKLFSDKAGKNEITPESVVIRSETGFDKQSYTNNGYTLNYCLYEPADLDKNSDNVPLVLFLHGAGERGSDNEAQLKNAILQVVGDNKNNEWSNAIIIAPQCPSSTGGNTNSDVNDPNKWAETPWNEGNYVQANVPESKPLHAAAELVKKYTGYDYVDADRVYVVGLSMGGFGTWDIISRYPELFTAAVPICGGGPADKIDVLKNIPIFTFHGSADNVVPYSGTQGMYNAITAAGGDKILFHTFSGAGHSIWNQAITFGGSDTLPSLESWLFSQGTENAIELPKTYTFDVSEEDEVFSSIVDNNGRDANGRLTSKKHNEGVFYELTQGASFTVDLIASKDCEVKFIIKLLGSGTYSCNDLIKSVSVTSGGQTTEAAVNGDNVTLGGWYISKGHTVNAEITNISLKEGKNTITFTMGDENVNVAGVAAVSLAEITHEAVNTEYGNGIKNYDPFVSDNGGTFITNGSDTQKVDNSDGVFYRNNQKTTFTFTVIAEKDTDAVLSLAIVFNNTTGYATNSIITSVTSMDANGQENTVKIADAVTVKCNGLTIAKSLRADFATISLKEGVNTITFTFGDNDVNIMGVYLKSDNEVVFGTKNTFAE